MLEQINIGSASKNEKNPIIIHGHNCKKVPHSSNGYLHSPEDDGHFDVDGVTYCGRCHTFLNIIR